MKFPKGFLFGLANADHQVESHDPKYEDVWDLWERTQNKTTRKQASEFEDKYPEDIARAAELGTKVFRFSVSWAKVQQEDGSWNQEALDHYRAVAQCVRDHDMEVMVTLIHFVWPVWLEKEGGLIAENFPLRFQAYADKLAESFGDLVSYWISFNEPTQLVHGYIKPWWQENYYMPPGMPEGTSTSGEAEAVGKLIYNLFSAHAKARVAIKEHKPEAMVGVNPLVTGFPKWLQWIMDHQFRTNWLLKATYTFSFKRPIIVENGQVDLLMGDLTPRQGNTLHYSQAYYWKGDDHTKGKHHIALPAGHEGLLQTVNRSIQTILKLPDEGGAVACRRPLSLADYFARQEGAPTCTVKNGEGLKRIKRRGVVSVGIDPNNNDPERIALEREIAEAIASEILDDPSCVEYVEVSGDKPIKALSTKLSPLNRLWRFFGAASLIANANWWYLGSRGKLPKELCPEEAYGAHDFIGFDYYWGLPTTRLHKFSHLLDAAEGRFLTAPVWPQGMGNAMRQFHRWFPDQEQFIIENGCVPLADGYRRRDYLNKHLAEVHKACEDGVPVKAYLLWSLTSNREWGHPFDNNTDFGLYFVDLDGDPNLERVPTSEVEFYRELIKNSQSDS